MPLARALGVTRGQLLLALRLPRRAARRRCSRAGRTTHATTCSTRSTAIEDPRERLRALFGRAGGKPPSIFVRLLDAAEREPLVAATLAAPPRRRAATFMARACRERGLTPAEARRQRAARATAAYVGLARLGRDAPGVLARGARARFAGHLVATLVAGLTGPPDSTLGARVAAPSAEQTLAQRLLAGDRRALARAITLVESRRPARLGARARGLPADRPAPRSSGSPARPGAGKSTLIGALTKLRRAQDRDVGGALDRPVLAVHARRAARRPHPPDRPLPRSGRVHPLDGQPRRARRAQRGGAAGRAADGRRRAQDDVFLETVGVGQAEVDIIDHADTDRARADARLGRLDPGAEGRRSWRSRTSSSSTRPTTR